MKIISFKKYCRLMDQYVMDKGYNFPLAAMLIEREYGLPPLISDAYVREFVKN